MRQKRKKRKSLKSLSDVPTKTTIENKLSRASLVLNYDFDYGVDLEHRIIKLTGWIDETMWDLLDSGLNQLEAVNKSKVTIKICSPGGSTYHALAIVGRIKASRAYIVTEGFGEVMSAATLILAAGRYRKISRYGFFMWHQSSYEFDGKHEDAKALVSQTEKEENLWAFWMAEMTGERPYEWWRAEATGADKYFGADELLTLGVVDEIF